MHSMSNPEVDGLQQQKTTLGSAPVSQEHVAEHVHPFMATIFPSSNGNSSIIMPCHKAQVSNWFQQHDCKFSVLQLSLQSPDLNPIEHFWDVTKQKIHSINVQMINLKQLCDAIMSIWTKISKESNI